MGFLLFSRLFFGHISSLIFKNLLLIISSSLLYLRNKCNGSYSLFIFSHVISEPEIVPLLLGYWLLHSFSIHCGNDYLHLRVILVGTDSNLLNAAHINTFGIWHNELLLGFWIPVTYIIIFLSQSLMHFLLVVFTHNIEIGIEMFLHRIDRE